MKARNHVFLIAFCVFTHCAGYALVSNPAIQQSTDERTKHPVTSKKNIVTSHEPAHSRYLTGKIPLPPHASTAKINRLKVVRNKSNGMKEGSLGSDRQPTSSTTKVATNPKLQTPTVARSSIIDGDFSNRHRAPIPGGIGGPGQTRRNTATISGTAIAQRR